MTDTTDTTETFETEGTEISETASPSLEEMFAASQELLAAVTTAQLAYEQSLLDLAKVNGSKTFTLNGQHYQVRSRENSPAHGRTIVYLCALDALPKTWLKGPKKKAAATTAESTETASEGVAEDTGDATVIE